MLEWVQKTKKNRIVYQIKTKKFKSKKNQIKTKETELNRKLLVGFNFSGSESNLN